MIFMVNDFYDFMCLVSYNYYNIVLLEGTSLENKLYELRFCF